MTSISSNTGQSDLIQTIARAIRNFVESQPGAARELTVTTFVNNRDARLAQAALTAINEAGYVIVPRKPSDDMLFEMCGDSPHQFPGGDWVEASDDLKRIYRAAINTGDANG